jgi:hypothetical protein
MGRELEVFMKKLFLTMAALSAIAAAAPAGAQYSNAYRGQYNNRSQIDSRARMLDARIEAGRQRGSISRAEVAWLRDQLWQLRRLDWQYGQNGLSRWEYDELRRRLNDLRRAIRDAELYRIDPNTRGGWWDRNRDGWDDRDMNRDGRWDVDTRYDSNRDGWDDRDYDRDGRWDDNAGGAGRDWNDNWDFDDGRWEDGGEWDDDRGGDRRWEDDGGSWQSDARLGADLRVGVRAPANLSAVPPEFRGRYIDGNGVYYRYDDGRIFQIDARTGLILSIISL